MAIGTLRLGIPTTGRVIGAIRVTPGTTSAANAGNGAALDSFQKADQASAALQRDRDMMLQKQIEMQREAELYAFLSNMLKMRHETNMRIIGNIG